MCFVSCVFSMRWGVNLAVNKRWSPIDINPMVYHGDIAEIPAGSYQTPVFSNNNTYNSRNINCVKYESECDSYLGSLDKTYIINNCVLC